MNCRDCQNLTSVYLSNELPLSAFPEYRAHIESCDKCKEDLYINYAINTALRQLNNDEDLSSDFAKEVENRLKSTSNLILRKKRRRIFSRICIVLELIGFTFLFCYFTPEEKCYAFKPEGEESQIQIAYYGVPSYMDTVLQGIYRYNDDMIQKKREAEKKGAKP